MDITNPDLTRKVLTALNPNKILREDQIEKQRFTFRKLDSETEEQKKIALQKSKSDVEKKIQASAPKTSSSRS